MARYLIALNSGVYANQAAAQAAIESSGAAVVKAYTFSLTFDVEATPEQLASISGIDDSVETNATAVVTLQTLNQNHLGHLASTSASGAENAVYQPLDSGAAGHVYIVDTGIYSEHEQFDGRNVNLLYSNFAGNFDDNSGHGTAMSSLIIGNTQGVSKNAVLHVIKLFDSNSGSITIGEILNALDAVLSHHIANDSTTVKVVCLPWVTPKNNFLDNKITEMNASNLVVVAAAGNNGADVDNYSPAGVNSVITVGAMNTDYVVTSFTNVPWSNPTTAYFNNYGAALDIFTLGVNVSCAGITDVDAYIEISGTSVASAIAAGAAIQWANLHPTKTSSQIKEIILQEGHLAGASVLVFDPDAPTSSANVYKSLVTVSLFGQVSLGSLPSGRILNIQRGQTVTKDLELNLDSGEDFRILDFAPLPTWATLDFTTGILTVNTSAVDESLAPGIYLFGVAGTVSGKTVVEEYSIGLYNSADSELEEAKQYYYDAENNLYDEVVSFQVAPSSQQK